MGSGNEDELTEKNPLYNVKMVARETGLTPAVLRAWEKRYGILEPQRSKGGQRLYSAEDISLLKWLVARKGEGMSISRAIDVWRDQSLHPASLPGIPPVDQVNRTEEGDMLARLAQDWVQACLSYHELDAELAIAKALAIASPERVCTRVIQRGLAELGEGWYQGKVSVQQEHFASALASRRLDALLSVASEPSRRGRILAACPPGEEHDLVLKMLSFILRWHGWEVIYLGANVSLERLDATLSATSPRLVLSTAQTLPAAASLVDLAKVAQSQAIPLAYGGGIFPEIQGLTGRIPGFYLGETLEGVPQALDLLLNQHPVTPEIQLPPAYAITLELFQEKQDLMIHRTRELLQSKPIAIPHLETANQYFPQAVSAALSLGEIDFLDFLVDWLNGLLKNYGVPFQFVQLYYQVFYQVVEEGMGEPAGPLLAWLSKFLPDGEGSRKPE